MSAAAPEPDAGEERVGSYVYGILRSGQRIPDDLEGIDTGSEEFLQQARLVLATPSAHARSLGHQADWEGVIRTFAAERSGHSETSLVPQLLAAGCMAALRAALTTWLHDDGRTDLIVLVTAALDGVGDGLRRG